MGVITNTDEFSSPIVPSRLFQALFTDAHNLMPKIMPNVIKSVQRLSGEGGIEGGPGSIQQFNYAEEGPLKYEKHLLDEVDRDNFLCKYSVIDGGILGDKLEKISFEVKFTAAKSDAGSYVKTTSKHYTQGDAELKQEEITAQKEKRMEIFKVVEQYLFENPDVYAENPDVDD